MNLNLEEQAVFARQRCRELAATRLAMHHVRRSLLADGLDRAIVDEAIAEYEVLLAGKHRTDRFWWRIGALVLFLACAAYIAAPLIGERPHFGKAQAVAGGIALLALLQCLMPMMPRR